MKKFRPDNITNPNDFCSVTAEQIYAATAALDNLVSEMEIKWGVDRLPTLVSAETAAKFGSAKAKLDAAIFGNDAAEVTKRASVMERAWQFLDAEATKRNAKPVSVKAHIWRDDGGQVHAFCKTNAEACAYAKDHKDVITWTFPEIVRIAEMFEDGKLKLLSSVKRTFPTSRVSKIHKKLDDKIDF